MKLVQSMLALLLAGSMSLVLAAGNRQQGAHEHGVGKLDIAQDGAELQIAFDSPAVNIVGFEHAPNSEHDHQILDKALSRLKDGVALFVLSPAASCRLLSADVDMPLAEHEEDEAHHDDEHDEHDEPHAEHEHQHQKAPGHETGHEATHSDITASWHFSCAHPEAVDQIGVRLFEAFPMTERLQVQFITESQQGAAELSASQPVLRF